MACMAGLRVLGISALALIALVAVACGGGGTTETPGERITDPARVPSSTPIQNPTLYKIRGNEVTLSGGESGAITPVAVETPTATDYIVQSGDFCSTIASEHGISTEELQAANRNTNCDALHVGDKMKSPAKVVATPTRGGSITGNPTVRPGTSGGAGTYTVQAGDTCGAIAAAKGVTLEAFLAANSAINATCSNLDAGQVVKIP